LDERLAESVRIHAQADVPVGSFLSGGYDSSALVHHLTAAGHRPETFSIGFEGWEDSEHLHAASVAQSLGVPLHHELVGEETLELLGGMPDVYDEPIADISILPTWLVSRLAARKVKAVTSGEGADELLGGYWWQRKIHELQPPPPTLLERLRFQRHGDALDVVSFYADAMGMGRFDRPEMERAFAPEHLSSLPDDPDWFYRSHFDRRLSPFKAVQRLDIKCFMGELVLVKVDRASMAHSLEVRVPFLDHELYADLLGVHEDCVVRPSVTKFLLHENLRGKVPDAILARKKQGFVGPEEHYSTFDLYRRGLTDSRLVADGIIRADYIESRFAEKDPWRLWKLFVLEQWYRRWL
jgi:asparagine synthase (glutamine-hydrolysing)